MASRDRTTEAVTAQLEALGTERFEVGALSRERKMIQRELSKEGVIRQIPRLKALNAQDHEIYVRPAGDHGWILIDDLTRSAIEKLDQQGLRPSLVVETSPQNYQAWLWMGRALPAEERLQLSRDITREFGGDTGAIGSLRYGRLPGFTNRKEKHRQANGMAPFVLLRREGREAVPAAEAWIGRAQDALQEEKARPAEVRRPAAGEREPARSQSPEDVFRVIHERIQPRVVEWKNGKMEVNLSRADYQTAQIMLLKGFDRSAIARAMTAESPGIEERKGKYVEQYVDRTVDAASQRARPKDVARALGEAARRLRAQDAAEELER